MIRFIASYPKSGQTWLRLFLIAHEDPDRFDINVRPPHHLQDTDRAYHERVSPAPLDQLSEKEMFAIRGAALVHMIRDHGTPYLKTHAANITLDWQDNVIPVGLTDRAVYVVRDPRDVAISFADHEGWSIDETIEAMADQVRVIQKPGGVRQPLASWSLHVRSWMREMPFNVCVVRYEDLVVDAGKIFRQVLEFLEIPFDPWKFRSALDVTSFENLANDERKHGFKAKSEHQKRFFRSGRSGVWRDVLTPDQVARMEADHGEVMRALRYR